MKTTKLLALSLLCAAGAIAQNAGLMPMPRMQFADANGVPLAGGLIYTCVAGSSCPGTPLATYTDSTAGTQNTNPVVLDSGGFASIWLGSSSYKVVAQTSLGVTQWTVDGVQNLGLAALSGSSAFPTISVTGNAGIGGSLSVSGLTVNGNSGIGAASATTIATTGSVTVGLNETVAGTLGVTGVATLASNATVGGTLGVTGAETVGGVLTVSGSKITLGGLQTSKIQLGTTGNTDLAGLISLTAGAGTYTFGGVFANAPICVGTDTTALNPVKVTTTTTTITVAGTGSDFVDYVCIARN
jgi:hypothetical protein